ncbi:MAG: ThiF family adenylyltransferase [Thermodesulfobacteriota bacterium]
MLSDSQIERYSRQIILPQVGGKGQEVLLRSKVLVNGDGLLQDAALLYLAAAGVGTVGLLGNCHSSLFAALSPARHPPAAVALTDLNPDCHVIGHREVGTSSHEQVVRHYDLVLSAPDEALHAACYALRRPFLCAAVTHTGGWFFAALGYQADSPCLQCVTARDAAGREGPLARALPPHPPVLSPASPEWPPLAMFLGALQATEAIKLLLGIDPPPGKKVWQCHFSPLHFSERVVEKTPQCPLCGSPSPS